MCCLQLLSSTLVFLLRTMTSLLSSIFGDKTAKKKADNSTDDLFANPAIVVPPPVVAGLKKSHKRKTDDTETKSEKKSKKDALEESPKVDDKESKDDKDETHDDEAIAHDVDDDDDQKNDADDRTVFVGNLPVGTTRRDLQRYFKSCKTKIKSTRIRSVATLPDEGVKLPPQQAGNQKLVRQILINQNKIHTSAKASVQGYVVFEDPAGVEEALKLNNTVIPVKNTTDNDGAATRRMRVDRVNKEYDARRSVFIGNLPYAADEESLRAVFCDTCGWQNTEENNNIEGVRIVRDKTTHQCKGFGYLLLADASLVATVLRTMEGVSYLGRPLRVRVCGKRFKSRHGNGGTNESSHSTTNNKAGAAGTAKSPKEKPVAVALKQMVKADQEQSKQNKRKRGIKKVTATGKSKRAAAEAKTNQRIKKIEKRIRKGMGKMRKK